MNQVFLIAYHEMISACRDTRLKWLGSLVLTFVLIASYTGFKAYEIQQKDRLSAQHQNRTEWENQEEKHPHLAAHYGTFVFKPKSFWSFFDFGLDNYTGTYVYLEAHKQNDLVFKPAQEQESSVRFGELSGAAILQLFIPLLIIFICYGSIAMEREQGMLKLLTLQGVSLVQMIWGKILGYLSLILILLLVAFVLALTVPICVANLVPMRQIFCDGAILYAIYALYSFVVVSSSVWVSACASSSKSALLVLLALWICMVIIVPKVTANVGDELYPLPSETEFKSYVSKDIEKGLDGHNSADVRAKILEKKYLEKYKVDSLHKLPVNFEGIMLLESEAYTSKVYDIHFNKLQQLYERQNKVSSYTSLLNPYMAVRNLSMAISQTDYSSHLRFKQQAESYRRYFVQEMNKDMAKNSKMNEFNVYKAKKDLWLAVPPFRYTPSTLADNLYHKTELLSLVLWVLLLPFLIRYTSYNINIVKS
ncbi:MAG TPA: DUF3526 domain-containing protein [Cytophagales bacterium]|nr:DUF3526 domain-containing protein [Cytophagales bacterium]